MWKRALIGLVSIVAVVFIAASVVVKFVATPEVLTPRVEEALKDYIKSEYSIESVDLTLVSNFPFVTLEIDSLRIAQRVDSLDDLLVARRCAVTINPYALLRKKVEVRNVELLGAKIFMLKSGDYRPIDHFNLGETEPQPEPQTDSLDSFDMSAYSVSLDRFVIDSAQIIVRDDDRKFYTRVTDFGVDLKLKANSRRGGFKVETGFGNLLVWRDGEVLIKKTSMKLSSTMIYDRDSMTISFRQADLNVNNIDLKACGLLRRDTVKKSIAVDVDASLSSPSLGEFLALVPSVIIDPKEGVSTSGTVDLNATIKGYYGDTEMPVMAATLKVDNATAKYASKKISLEDIDCDADIYVDFNQRDSSYVDIRRFTLSASDIIKLSTSGKVTDMIDAPHVDLNVNSNIDFNRIDEVIPLQKGIDLKGSNRSDLRAQFRLSDIQRSNYGGLYLDGESRFNDVSIEVDGKQLLQDSTSKVFLSIQMDRGSLLFGDRVKANKSRTLLATVNFTGFGFKDRDGQYASIKDLQLRAGANFDQRTSKMIGVGVNALAQNTVVGIDSLFSSKLKSSDITLTIAPKTEERGTYITTKISSQQIEADEPNNNSDLSLSKVDMELKLLKLAEKQWDVDGDVGFSDFKLFTDMFPIDIAITDTDVAIKNSTISLNNAEIKMGDSEMIATGEIHYLIRKLFIDQKAPISGKLSVRSPFLDVTQLIEATNKSVMMEPADSVAQADSVAVASDSTLMLLLPRRSDFIFDFNVDKMHIYEAKINNIAGRAHLNKRDLEFTNLKLGAIGAQADGTMTYSNLSRKKSSVFMDFKLREVDINRIGELSSAINTMFPMLKSFEGVVDFDFKANTEVNPDMTIDVETLRSAMSFKGTDLVLMDSETFASLSKMLMFKNKKRNLIDSLNAYAVVEKDKVDVLPFEMFMDRYRFIVGGTQTIDFDTFDVDFKYNVSILKSPLPFKAGVDIDGDLEDFDFKITRAKLKNSNFVEIKNYYDEFCQAIVKSEKAPRKRKLVKDENEIETDSLSGDGVDSLVVSDSLVVEAVDSLVDGAVVDSLLVEETLVDSLAVDSLISEL